LNMVSKSRALINADLPSSLGRQNTQSSYGFLQQFSMRNVFEFMISCSLLVQVGGTVLSAKLAKDKGWAINLGGGFHHCCSNEGGGFCAYADITLTIQFAFARLDISRVMIIDLDAHQGNGHEHDFMNNRSIYILDMYNSDIYPRDATAKTRIDLPVAIKSYTTTEKYLDLLSQALEKAAQNFEPDLLIYNAGTDILDGDPLGRLLVSPDGVKQRDEMVFKFSREKNCPIVMLTSGGYMKTSARVIADSIGNLATKGLIHLPSS
jgi:histone deacetylase 11